MKIKVSKDITITIPASLLITQMKNAGYKVTDMRESRAGVGENSFQGRLYSATFMEAKPMTLFQALSIIIPRTIDEMAGGTDPKASLRARKGRVSTTDVVNNVKKHGGGVIGYHINNPIITGRFLALMAKKTPLLQIKTVSAQKFYEWKPYDKKWVAVGANPSGIASTEELKAQIATFKGEEYLPLDHPKT